MLSICTPNLLDVDSSPTVASAAVERPRLDCAMSLPSATPDLSSLACSEDSDLFPHPPTVTANRCDGAHSSAHPALTESRLSEVRL